MSRDETMTDERLESAERRLDDLERKFLEAFPNGDFTGHCRYHEIQIEILLAKRKLIAAVQEKTISGLVWAFMVGLGIAVWQWFKGQIRG